MGQNRSLAPQQEQLYWITLSNRAHRVAITTKAALMDAVRFLADGDHGGVLASNVTTAQATARKGRVMRS